MENSKLPFQYWMLCIEQMTLSKKSFSALEMQGMLGHKHYEPILLMMHKIRRVMSKRDEKYKLNGCVEFDEGFFERVDNKEVRNDKSLDINQTLLQKKRGEVVKDKQKYWLWLSPNQALKLLKKESLTEK
jgi:hypothetical protein